MVESLRLVSLESRRSGELRRLLERAGFGVLEAPSMQELSDADQAEALAFSDRLVAADYDWLVLLTGVGFRRLLDAAFVKHQREVVLAALATRPIACRGPKPVAVLKELGMRSALVAPEPNTYRELISAFDGLGPLVGKRLVVQEYGVRNVALAQAFVDRGADVTSVSVYGWGMPDDLRPLRRAIHLLCAGEAEGLVLTSQQQLQHLFAVAEQEGRAAALHRVLRTQCLVASVGPITSEALQARGIGVDLEPERPKMGHLVKLLKAEGSRLLLAKRQRACSP